MTTKNLLAITAAGEGAFGLIALVYPPVVVGLLFGADIAGAGIVMSRLAGISLIALGVTCWPSQDPGGGMTHRVAGMLTYNSLATLYLGSLGIGGVWVGELLWPAVVLHLVVTLLYARVWLGATRTARA